MGIGRLGRIGSNLSHDNIHTHGGRIDGLTYTNALMYGLPDTRLYMTSEGPGLSAYSNAYYNWINLFTRKINSDTFQSNQVGVDSRSDYTGPLDVEEKFFNLTGSPGAGDYRIYIAHKVTASPTYENDCPICGVQVLDIDGTVLHTILVGSTSVPNWQSLEIGETNSGQQSSLLSPYSYNNANYTWSDLNTSGNTGRFSLASSTGSYFTGIEGSPNLSEYYTNDIPFPAGLSTMSQDESLQFMFRETSGSLINTFCLGRTKIAYAFPLVGSIRIIHANTTRSSTAVSQTETLRVGIAP
mgnify:FL=1